MEASVGSGKKKKKEEEGGLDGAVMKDIRAFRRRGRRFVLFLLLFFWIVLGLGSVLILLFLKVECYFSSCF